MDASSGNDIKAHKHGNGNPATVLNIGEMGKDDDALKNVVELNEEDDTQGLMNGASNENSSGGSSSISGVLGSPSHNTVKGNGKSNSLYWNGKMFFVRFFQDPLKVFLLCVIFLLLIFSIKTKECTSSSSLFGYGKVKLRGSLNTVWGLSTKEEFHFAIVTDLDRMSKVSDAKEPTWKSFFKRGVIIPSIADDGEESFKLVWQSEKEIFGHIGEAGRGMELSELVTFQNKLLAFDDRTGIAYEIEEKSNIAIPRYIMMEGHGSTDKGQKTEWATVKDGVLYVGSFGKEYTNNDGSVKNRWNLWVSKINPNGEVTHEDWTARYDLLREATNSKFPGYMIQEAIHWDDIRRQWVVLPRRISSEKFDEKLDERRGSNLMLVVNEDFTKVEKIIKVGPLVELRGWSTFKFLPGTKNRYIAALKSEEEEDKATGSASQRTFITVFRYEDGKEMIPQTLVSADHKFEGLEFL